MPLRIKELRERKGLTQVQLAEMAGVSRSQLSEIENERKPANTLRLAAIAKSLGVPVDELFGPNGTDIGYRGLILDLMAVMSDEDRLALIRHAQALARRE